MSHEKVSLMSRPFPPIPNFGSTGSNGANSDDDKDGRFVCNICLDPVVDPVSTLCGHLYCWPCLYRWLDTQHTTCPVCLAGVSRENVIPLFIKGSENDPRSSSQGDIPNRPNGQRPEVSPAARNTGTGLGTGTGHYGGLPFTAGFGFFPSLFGLQFQSFVDPLPVVPGRPPTAVEQEQESISRMLIGLCCIVFLCLFLF